MNKAEEFDGAQKNLALNASGDLQLRVGVGVGDP
jgi:hypothetical protein